MTAAIGAATPATVAIVAPASMGFALLLQFDVGCSPFSTNGDLIVANSQEHQRDIVFRRLMTWGRSLVVLAPLGTWLALVVPGRL